MAMIQRKVGLVAMLIAAICLALPLSALAVETTDPIRIVTIDSTDGDFLAYVYGEILNEKGYNVKYVRVDYTAEITGLETGDLDVTTSVWETTSYKQMMDAVATGKVENFGTAGVEVVESWWYPKYMEEVCPGLPDWTALKNPDCVKALSTAETAPKGRFLDAPPDWETEAGDRIKALDLDLEVISSGSIITMIAAVRSAIDRKEPVLSWGFIPHWFFNQTPGEFVQLPAYDVACFDDPAWGINKESTYDCGYKAGHLWKLANSEFSKRAPKAAELLRKFEVKTMEVADATDRVENGNEKIEDVAKDWINKNRATWEAWID